MGDAGPPQSRGSLSYSILVPIYCEASSIAELCGRIADVFASMGKADDFEIVFVDDGSTDDTAAVLRRITTERRYVRAVTLRRNCGKSLALSAGLRYVRGKVIITMDGDLQDNPEDIPAMLVVLDRGNDLVNGWRVKRQDTFIRKIGSRVYNATVKCVSGLRLHDMNCGMKAYRSDVVRALSLYGQYHRYIPLQAHLAGFKVTETPVSNSPRKFGSSKFRTFRYEGLFDLISLVFLHRYGLRPMHFFGKISLAIVIPSALILVYLVLEQARYWLGIGEPVLNRPLLAFSLTSFLLGVLIFTTGFVCDFILHHQIQSRMNNIIGLNLVNVTDGSGKESEEHRP
jgi:glycosyltransferase involved in cell wall biosynthesis